MIYYRNFYVDVTRRPFSLFISSGDGLFTPKWGKFRR